MFCLWVDSWFHSLFCPLWSVRRISVLRPSGPWPVWAPVVRKFITRFLKTVLGDHTPSVVGYLEIITECSSFRDTWNSVLGVRAAGHSCSSSLLPPIFFSWPCHGCWVTWREFTEFICCFFTSQTSWKKHRAQNFQQINNWNQQDSLVTRNQSVQTEREEMENWRHINLVLRWAPTFLTKRKMKKECLIRWYAEHAPK